MKDGLRAKCKSCANAHRKAYREANKERIAAQRKAHYEENKEKVNAYTKAHYEENRERIRAKQKAHYEANKERIAAQRKTYYEENKESLRTKHKTYYDRLVSNSPCAIYSIFCVPEQRYYIGQTVCVPRRWGTHNRKFKNNKNNCGAGEMQNDYNKHGPESFEYTILKELPTDANEETRLEEEKNHILQFLTEGKSLYNVYNTTE